ncbi:hypothetical protein [Sediminibacter sp. Hel_I_10]|uniref:hypothetical protein n=1 Tax=Sediminibacter sp. Hel_I_10 TaxID=1392490 RepID=UPI0006912B04|nr:hypothetical protein [Sediminibacter sp. Hel_I_10]
MEINKDNHGSKSFGEDNKLQVTENHPHKTQEKIIFSYLLDKTATNSMISVSTGIARASICKSKRKLEDQWKLFEVKKDVCKVSGHKASFLTTNPKFIGNQISLQNG